MTEKFQIIFGKNIKYELITNHIINELLKIPANILWKKTFSKIWHKILISEHKGGTLKCFAVAFKAVGLSYSWFKRVYGESFNT